MSNNHNIDPEFEEIIQLQLLEYEATNCRPRPLTPSDMATHALLQSAILTSDVLRAAEVECDGNDTVGKLDAAFEKLKSALRRNVNG